MQSILKVFEEGTGLAVNLLKSEAHSNVTTDQRQLLLSSLGVSEGIGKGDTWAFHH